jgi:DNA-binding PadR family transcriptional regulator
MLEELREHGYNVSPGTLYPMLARLCRLGWLEPVKRGRKPARTNAVHYRLTKSGRAVLVEVQTRLKELLREVF